MYQIALLLAVAVWAPAEGHTMVKGECTVPPNNSYGTVPSPNLFNKVLYLRSSFNNFLFEDDKGISSTLYVKMDDSPTILNGTYTQYHTLTPPEVRTGVTDLSDPAYKNSLVMDTKFDQIRGGHKNFTVPLQLIASDGENYGVLYSCQQSEGLKLEMALAYTVKDGDGSYDDKIKAAVEKIGLGYRYFKNYHRYDMNPSDSNTQA